MSLSMLDWVIVLVILLSTVQAISQGFLREFFSLMGILAGYLVAAWEYPNLALLCAHYIQTPWIADLSAFFAIFIIVALIGGSIGRLSSWAVRSIGLRWFDRLLGAAFGFIRGIVVSAVIVVALAAFAPHWGLQQSRIAPFMLVTSRGLIWAAPADLRRRFWDGWNLLRTVPEHLPLEHNDQDHP